MNEPKTQHEVWFRLESPSGGWSDWTHSAVSTAALAHLRGMEDDGLADVRTSDPHPCSVVAQ